MDSGRFRHVLKLQNKQVIRDAYGGEDITYSDIVTLRGSAEYTSGKDGFTADQFYGKNILKFTTRYYPNTSVIDRIVYDNREFDIIPPIKNVTEENRYMIIYAEEKAK